MKLLVSVTDAAEATRAAEGGAHIIDVKNPATGALGAASPRAVRQVREATPPHLPVSAALGDGPFEPGAAAEAARLAARCGARFVKIGLRRTTPGAALEALRVARQTLPETVGVILAGFADFERAGAPAPLDLPRLARAAQADGCLVDTAVKDGLGLFHWLDDEALGSFVEACRDHGLLSALAGSLKTADFSRVAAIGPDVVGVRGAACDGDRVTGQVNRTRVEALARALGR
jgi:hypothetical protein